MPDPILDAINNVGGNTTAKVAIGPGPKPVVTPARLNNQYNPGTTDAILDAINNIKVPTPNISTNVSQGNILAPGPYNTSDLSSINVDKEITNGYLRNAWNSFKQGIDQIQIATGFGKFNYSMLGDSAADILDKYPDNLKDLNDQLSKGIIDQGEFSKQKSNLDANYQNALQEKAKFDRLKVENELEIKNEPVSKEFQFKSWLTQQAGDQGSTWDKIFYSMPQVVGSSASLMGPQLLATFGTNISKALLRSSISYLAGPEVGLPVNGIATVGAIAMSVGEVLWGRAQESYGEVGSTIEENQRKLFSDYAKSKGYQTIDQVPNTPQKEEDLRKLRIQSRAGADRQFNENMALAASDVAQAMLMPGSKLASAVGELTGPVGTAIKSAKDYNRLTRMLTLGGEAYANAMSEKFEEGFQQAAQYRAQDAALNLNNYTNKGLMQDILTDAWDTASSLNYSLIPGIDLRGTGKYSQDKEFQFAENSGGMLGLIMGAIPTSISVAKDIMAYKAATKDLARQGAIDPNDKVFRLQDNILERYIKTDKLQFLAEAMRSLRGKQDENGVEILNDADFNTFMSNIKNANNIYQTLAERVNNLGGDKWAFFNSKELSQAKAFLKSDMFHTAMNLVRMGEDQKSLALEKNNALSSTNLNITDPQLNTYSDLTSQYEQATKALEGLKNLLQLDLNTIENVGEGRRESLNKRVEFLQRREESLKRALSEEESNLRELGIDFSNAIASPQLDSVNYNQLIGDINLNEQQERYNELLKIKNHQQAKSWFEKAMKERPIASKSKMDTEEGAEQEEPLGNSTSPIIDNTAEHWGEEEEIESTQSQPGTAQSTNNDTEVSQATPNTEAEILASVTGTTDQSIPDDISDEDLMQYVNEDFRERFRNALDDLSFDDITPTDGKTTIAERVAIIEDLFNSMGLDPKTLSFKNIFKIFKANFADDSKYVRDKFNLLKSVVAAIKSQDLSEAGQKAFEETIQSKLDTNTLDLVGQQEFATPPVQTPETIEEGNNKTLDTLQNRSEQRGSGLKIESGLSIATSNIEFVTEGQDNFDQYDENGKLKFRDSGDDQHLVNTNKVGVGSVLNIRSIDIPEGFDYNDLSDENLDRIPIEVVLQDERDTAVGKVTENYRIGYLHKLESLPRLLAESSDLTEELNKLREQRKEIILGKGNVFTASVTNKGFGFLNVNRRDKQVSTGVAFSNDPRVHISTVNASGVAVQQRSGIVYASNVRLIPGSTVAFIPNETDTGTVYVPMYLTKNKLGRNIAILDSVTKSLTEYLKTGSKRFIDESEDYIYTTYNKTEANSLFGNRGVFWGRDIKGNAYLNINGKNYNAANVSMLKTALSEVYFDPNRVKLKDSTYHNQIMNSGLLTTNITRNEVLANKGYTLPNDQQYQYFSQHTIVLGSFKNTNTKADISQMTQAPEITQSKSITDLTVDEMKALPNQSDYVDVNKALNLVNIINDNNRDTIVGQILEIVNNKAIPRDKFVQVLKTKEKLIGNSNYFSPEYLQKYILLSTKDFSSLEQKEQTQQQVKKEEVQQEPINQEEVKQQISNLRAERVREGIEMGVLTKGYKGSIRKVYDAIITDLANPELATSISREESDLLHGFLTMYESYEAKIDTLRNQNNLEPGEEAVESTEAVTEEQAQNDAIATDLLSDMGIDITFMLDDIPSGDNIEFSPQYKNSFKTDIGIKPELGARYTEKEVEVLKEALNAKNRELGTNHSLNISKSKFGNYAVNVNFEVREADDINPNSVSLASKLIVSPEISISLQNQMVDSVAFQLLTNQKGQQDETNKEAVRSLLQAKLDTFNKLLGSNISPEMKNKLKILQNNYSLMMKHYDGIHAKSLEVLAELGYKPNDDTDYFENLEEYMEDNNVTQFNDDSNRKRNQKDFLPADVKKMLYFIPQLEMRDLTNPEQVADMNNPKSAYYGKNYRAKINSLGLPSFNDFNDTWEKTLSILSERTYSSDISGLNKMLEVLKGESNPAIVKEVAESLQKSGNQVKNAFFRRTYLQRQQNRTTLVTYKNFRGFFNEFTQEYEPGSTVKQTQIINSDQRTGVRFVRESMEQDFRNQGANLGILEVKLESETGRAILAINNERGKELLSLLKDITSNQDSLLNLREAVGNIGSKKSTKFTDQAKVQIYSLVREAGINISFPAFTDLLKYYKSSGVELGDEKGTVNEVFERTIFSTLAGQKGYNRATEGEVDETEVPSLVDYDNSNPFKKDQSTMHTIARFEYGYRVQNQSGSYRQGGNTYYPFVRHSYLSEMFTDIKNLIKNGEGGEKNVLGKLQHDSFAKFSLYLEAISNPVENSKFNRILNFRYELGTSNKTGLGQTKLLQEMTEREHQIAKLVDFQNSGNDGATMHYDTLSDKITKPVIDVLRQQVMYSTASESIDQGNIQLSDETLNALYRAFLGEYTRINDVIQQNKQLAEVGENYKLIKNYHDIGNKEGLGKLFNIYYFLNKSVLDVDNPDLSQNLYRQDGTLQMLTPSLELSIKEEINKHMNKVFVKTKNDFKALKLYDLNAIDAKGRRNPNIQDLVDSRYLIKNAIKLGLENFKGLYRGKYRNLDNSQLEQIVDYSIVDYVVNYTIFSNEMLMFTGDPAQAGKPADKSTIEAIKEKFKDDIKQQEKYTTIAHIESTFVNVGKRNAAFLGSGEKGLFDQSNYNVAIANDEAIDSEQLNEYLSYFPGNQNAVKKAYGNGDLTDAQEVTTVEEKLHVMKAFGQINDEQYKKFLYIYDREHFNTLFPNETLQVTQKDRFEAFGIVMQPDKPVQRTYNIDPQLKMSKQYYIKTSSFPLVPDLVRGTPLEKLVNDMKKKGVNRVAFVSATKQGVAGSKGIFNKEGDYNESFLENNINTLDREAFRIQLEVPYKDSKDEIREGTQLSKLLFVDMDRNLELNYQGQKVSVEELEQKYNQYHGKIIDIQTDSLLEELGAERTTTGIRITDMKKLAKIIQEEGIGRGYSINSLLGLDLNERGEFKIPLTFIPNTGQIQPVLTAIVSNRISRLKMPGKSYVQGSEFILKTGKKGEVKTEVSEKDKRSIVWTKPEYSGLNKLQYLREENGQIKPAQIIMPFYFIDWKGDRVDLREFTIKDEEGRTLVDTTKIDPELLEMNGFRIPFQGHNSGMWFEIVGFLPYEMGDLIVVPGEIAAQMGSDYDVDKLYAYMFNYDIGKEYTRYGNNAEQNKRLKEEVFRLLRANNAPRDNKGKFTKEAFLQQEQEVLKSWFPDGNIPSYKVSKKEGYLISKIHALDPSTIEEYQNALIDIHKAIFTSKEMFQPILDPLSFADVEAAIDELGSEESKEFLGAFDPTYQRDVYFSNRGGQLGVGITANSNTSHAIAQSINLFIKGEGIVFQDENGNNYVDQPNSSDKNRVNRYDNSIYRYTENDQIKYQNDGTQLSAWRLDKVYTFTNNPKTNEPYKISNLISQLLGVSVDNAKEQKLGAYGLNKHNFNVALTIVRSGFDLIMTKAFINQPILKEYYEAIGDTEDIFKTDFTPNKKEKVVLDLYTKYSDKFGVPNPAYSDKVLTNMKGLSLQELKQSLQDGEVTQGNVEQQLNILSAFLKYKTLSDGLQALTSASNIDTKGLPKNVSETINKRSDIEDNIISNVMFGNTVRMMRGSIPGLFTGLPTLFENLFANPQNPIFAYTSPGYINAQVMVEQITGRTISNQDSLDNFHNNIKQYAYSSANTGRNKPANEVRRELLFDYEGNESLQTRFLNLKAQYPNNDLLKAINPITSIYPNDPKLLEITLSAEEDYTDKIRQYWEGMLNNPENTELLKFAEDLVSYALLVSPQEFGSSNIIKYIPFKQLERIGLTDTLNQFQKNVFEDENLLIPFVEQFLQHNLDYTISAREEHLIDKYTVYEEVSEIKEGKEVRTRTSMINEFALMTPDETRVDNAGNKIKNPSAALLREQEDGSYDYPGYISMFIDQQNGKALYKRVNKDSEKSSYMRIDKLGANNVSEYTFDAVVTQQSLFEANQAGLINIKPSSSINSFDTKPIDTKNQSLEQKYIPVNTTADDLLSRIIGGLQGMDSSSNKYIGLFKQLALSLQQSNINTAIVNNPDIKTRATTTTLGNSRVININPSILFSASRTGLPIELDAIRTMLHEMLHAITLEKLGDPSYKQSQSYKNLDSVWREYRRMIRYEGVAKTRGINVSVLNAEIFSILKSRYDYYKNSGDKRSDIYQANMRNTIQKLVENQDEFNSVLKELEDRFVQMQKNGEIEKANYDLFSNAKRVEEIKNTIVNQFMNHLPEMIDKYYAYYSIDEFVTEAMTNPTTQEMLQKTPSIWKRFKTALAQLFAKFLGNSVEDRTLLDDAVDAIVDISELKVDENSTKEPISINQISEEKNENVDKYQYFGAIYNIKLDENGKGIDVINYQGKSTNKQRLLDSYNRNPDVDPQNNKYFRNPKDSKESVIARQYKLPNGKVITFNLQQFEGLNKVKNWLKEANSPLFTLSGFAGTGKSTMIKAVLDGFAGKVVVSAPTHAAKNVISKTTGRPSMTLQALLGLKPNTDIDNFDPTKPEFEITEEVIPPIRRYDWVIIDEASMINKKLFEYLLDEARRSNTKILFMGDMGQIPPVGENMSEVFVSPKIKDSHHLTQVERQADSNPLMGIYDSIRQDFSSSQDLFDHKTKLNEQGEGIEFTNVPDKFLGDVIEAFNSEAYEQDKNYAKIIAYRNEMVQSWNQVVREALFGKGANQYEVGDILTGYDTMQNSNLYNSYVYEVVNARPTTNPESKMRGFIVQLKEVDNPLAPASEMFIVENSPETLNQYKTIISSLIAEARKNRAKWPAYYRFKESHLLPVDLKEGGQLIAKKSIDYGYAITAHKSQGSTYNNVFVLENDIDRVSDIHDRNRIKYVAFSRPTNKVTSFSNKTEANGKNFYQTHDDLTASLPRDYNSVSDKEVEDFLRFCK